MFYQPISNALLLAEPPTIPCAVTYHEHRVTSGKVTSTKTHSKTFNVHAYFKHIEASRTAWTILHNPELVNTPFYDETMRVLSHILHPKVNVHVRIETKPERGQSVKVPNS